MAGTGEVLYWDHNGGLWCSDHKGSEDVQATSEEVGELHDWAMSEGRIKAGESMCEACRSINHVHAARVAAAG